MVLEIKWCWPANRGVGSDNASVVPDGKDGGLLSHKLLDFFQSLFCFVLFFSLHAVNH